MGTKHKHAEVIKAWADGAEVEYFPSNGKQWLDVSTPGWYEDYQYRIKPEPKPDVVKYCFTTESFGHSRQELQSGLVDSDGRKPNLKIVFDGETGALKSAEVLK